MELCPNLNTSVRECLDAWPCCRWTTDGACVAASLLPLAAHEPLNNASCIPGRFNAVPPLQFLALCILISFLLTCICCATLVVVRVRFRWCMRHGLFLAERHARLLANLERSPPACTSISATPVFVVDVAADVAAARRGDNVTEQHAAGTHVQATLAGGDALPQPSGSRESSHQKLQSSNPDGRSDCVYTDL